MAEGKKQPLLIAGMDLTDAPPTVQVLVCGGGLFVGFGIAALSQEYAIRELHFAYSSILGASIPLAIFGFGACLGGLRERKAPVWLHLVCGVLSLITFQFSALSPMYLNYPTHIIFKSSKILPTMLVGTLWLRQSYSVLDYVAALLLMLGLTTFVLADASVTPNFDSYGVLIISIALFADAFVGNVQEKLFKEFKASQNEVATWSMGFAFALSMFIGLTFGTDAEGLSETFSSSLLVVIVVAFALSNYIGTYFVLTMIRRFGAAATVFTTSVCKAATMALSFILFPKPFTLRHLSGVLLVAVGVYVNVRAKQAARTKPTAKDEETVEPSDEREEGEPASQEAKEEAREAPRGASRTKRGRVPSAAAAAAPLSEGEEDEEGTSPGDIELGERQPLTGGSRRAGGTGPVVSSPVASWSAHHRHGPPDAKHATSGQLDREE